MQDQYRIRKGFNLLAPFYDVLTMVFSFNFIHKSQKWPLYKSLGGKNILVFGGGTGRFLVELMKNCDADYYCYLDISDKMIEMARKKVNSIFSQKEIDSVHFICGSYFNIPPDKSFDIIITHYSLDCFSDNELPLVLSTLNKQHNDKGAWLFADFNIPKTLGYKTLSRLIIQVLCLSFNLLCGLRVKRLQNFEREFNNLGYTQEEEEHFLGGLLVSRIYRN